MCVHPRRSRTSAGHRWVVSRRTLATFYFFGNLFHKKNRVRVLGPLISLCPFEPTLGNRPAWPACCRFLRPGSRPRGFRHQVAFQFFSNVLSRPALALLVVCAHMPTQPLTSAARILATAQTGGMFSGFKGFPKLCSQNLRSLKARIEKASRGTFLDPPIVSWVSSALADANAPYWASNPRHPHTTQKGHDVQQFISSCSWEQRWTNPTPGFVIDSINTVRHQQAAHSIAENLLQQKNSVVAGSFPCLMQRPAG